MWENPKVVLNKKPNFEKLIAYGFIKQMQDYVFSTDIMNGDFGLNIYVSEHGDTKLQIIDKETGEEYTLAYVASSVGSFVGTIRKECESVLATIVQVCYEMDIFKNEYTKLVIQYIKTKYGADAEYLWENSPDNAIFREPKTLVYHST